jgi:hypothetical protein
MAAQKSLCKSIELHLQEKVPMKVERSVTIKREWIVEDSLPSSNFSLSRSLIEKMKTSSKTQVVTPLIT